MIDLDEVGDRFANEGVEATVRVQPAQGLAFAVREAAGRADAVVVGGGDGTLRTAVEALTGTGVPLGVLPLGTFNHFARGLGLPVAMSEAVRGVATGVPTPISVGRINGHLFLNNAALGMAPDVVVRRREIHGSKAVRALVTAPVAVAALLQFQRLRLKVHLEGRAVSCETPFVFLTPNDYEPHLFRFAVRARRDDGRLNVYLTTPDGPVDALRMAFHVLCGHLDEHLDASDAGRIELASHRPVVPVLMDGDVLPLRSPLVIEGVSDAVDVLIPRPDSASIA